LKELMSIQEVASYLKVSPQTIYRRAQAGEIPAIKVGNRWRFRLTDIEGWLTDQRPTAKRVLVIDDDASITRLFVRTLEPRGHEVAVARNGEEGLKEVMRYHFDLIFLDMVLPGMSGPETMREIMRLDGQAKFILITGYPDSALLEQALSLGAFVVLGKPFTGEQIVEAVQKFS